MTFVPFWPDYAVVAGTCCLALIEILLMPWVRRHRTAAYAYMTGYLWLAAIAIVFIWYSTNRQWEQLLLGHTPWWRALIGFSVAGVYVFFMARHRKSLLRPKAHPAVARAMHAVEWMMPRTRAERFWCVILSVTAGTCEEIIFRGFAVTFFAYFTGLPIAILLSAAAFGLGHAYQDRKAILPTGLFGLAMNVLVLVSGSLLPAVAIHIFQDLVMTEIGHYAVTARDSSLET